VQIFVNHFVAVRILFKTIIKYTQNSFDIPLKYEERLDWIHHEPIDVTSGTFGELIQLRYDVTLHQSPK